MICYDTIVTKRPYYLLNQDKNFIPRNQSKYQGVKYACKYYCIRITWDRYQAAFLLIIGTLPPSSGGSIHKVYIRCNFKEYFKISLLSTIQSILVKNKKSTSVFHCGVRMYSRSCCFSTMTASVTIVPIDSPRAVFFMCESSCMVQLFQAHNWLAVTLLIKLLLLVDISVYSRYVLCVVHSL